MRSPTLKTGFLDPHDCSHPVAASQFVTGLATEEASAKIGAHDRNATNTIARSSAWRATPLSPKRSQFCTGGEHQCDRAGAAAPGVSCQKRSSLSPPERRWMPRRRTHAEEKHFNLATRPAAITL